MEISFIATSQLLEVEETRESMNHGLGLASRVLAHGLSQQGVWVPFWTPKPLKRTPVDTHFFCVEISKNLNLKLIIEFIHLLIVPLTLFNDIMTYFDEFIYVYGWNMSIMWSPLKIWTPKIFTIANFRHPVSKSWLRPCAGVSFCLPHSGKPRPSHWLLSHISEQWWERSSQWQ